LFQAKGGQGVIKVCLFVIIGLRGGELVARPQTRNLG